MNNGFVGRKKEIAILSEAFASKRAEMIAIYGRRRIGKTHLVRHFYKKQNAFLLEITGESQKKMVDQIKTVQGTLEEDYGFVFTQAPKQWRDIFRAIKKFHKANDFDHFVLFIDELPWMATPKSGLVSTIGHYWNTYFEKDPNCTVVLCGSAAAWMVRNIAGDKGELHQRISRTINLMPFDLAETREFLKNEGFSISDKTVIDYYISLGGVAKYLSHLNPTRSFAQNINNLCFSVNGQLFKEFPKLFTALFGRTGYHQRIVEELGKNKSKRLTSAAIAQNLGLSSRGASVYSALEDLEGAGFITSYRFYNQKTRDTLYALTDPFCLFHLKWIKDLHRSTVNSNPNYWQSQTSTQSWRSWSGIAFENVCHVHIGQIKKALGIGSVITESYYWSAPAANGKRGAQIDLLLKRKDQTVTIIECKYYEGVFTIDATYKDNLINKRERFSESDKEGNAITFALITTNGTRVAGGVDFAYDNLLADALFESI